MDAVITYVDNTDPIWYEEFAKWSENEVNEHNFINAARYRPWNNLQYCLRSIEKNAPFIRKVHLIVSGPSQVPNWINTDTVNVVFHKDIIPKEYLPTFNSRTIEMCMHNIKDLDEEFIYFNDDMFIVRKLKPTDFFEDGCPANTICMYTLEGLKNAWGKSDIYFLPHKRCTDKVKEILNIGGNQYYLTNHGPSPMLKSNNIELFDKLKDDILPTLTKFRTKDDYVHFMYSIYNYLKGSISDFNVLTNTYVSSNRVHINKLPKTLSEIKTKVCCINDIAHIEGREDYENAYMGVVNDFLDMLFPNVSKYENPIKVGLCVIVKNENRYLREFCQYYKDLGFSNIYLYDNNDKHGEIPDEAINDYIKSGFVVYHNMRGLKRCQQIAYNNCYNKYSNDCDWIAFFDADEFLELYHHDNISSFMAQNKFTEYDCVCVNWRCYGDNGNILYENRPVVERFTTPIKSNVPYFDPAIAVNYYIKSIVKTGKNAVFTSVHYPNGVSICNTYGTKCRPSIYQKPVYCNACIRHYITKSMEEYIKKCMRGYPNMILTKQDKLDNIKRYFELNDISEEKLQLISDILDTNNDICYYEDNGTGNIKISYE
jgi:hypothetical protein